MGWMGGRADVGFQFHGALSVKECENGLYSDGPARSFLTSR